MTGLPCGGDDDVYRYCRRSLLDLPTIWYGCTETDQLTTSVTFWDHSYEGDAFFWCLDKSGSMDVDDHMATLKTEMTEAIQQLSRDNEFGIVAFSTNTVVWSAQPVRAHVDNKTHAIDWVQNLEAEGWTCLEPAALATIQLANLSSKDLTRIIIVGDGVPICDGQDRSAACLVNITAANYLRTPIDTVFIGSGSAGLEFMQQLATMNQGSARQVQ